MVVVSHLSLFLEDKFRGRCDSCESHLPLIKTIYFPTAPSSNFNIFIPHCFKTCFQHLLQIKIALCYENRTRSITLPFPDIYLPAASGIAMHTRTINNVIPTTGQSGTVNGTII